MRPERSFGLLALTAGLCLVSPVHSLDGFLYSRNLDVPAGTVSAPLDVDALRQMAPGGADLRVFAPDGSAVPFRLSVTGPALTVATRGARCGLGASPLVCTLELPAGQILRHLTLEVEGEGTLGYRLYAPREARWELLAEGTWQQPAGEGAVRHGLAGRPQPIPGSRLRLELHGAEPPRLLGYALDLAVPAVVFQAPVAGRYVLACGGSLPSLPGGPGAPLGRIRFSNAWTVSPLEAEPGDLVRLELPAAVYGAAREDLGDLRLATGDRQIPFFRWSPPDPMLTAAEPGLQPARSDRPEESRVLISLPSDGLPLSQLHLTAPAAPLRRRVTVLSIDPERQFPEMRPLRSTWECVPEPPLPCRVTLPLAGPAPRLLAVRLRDGDNPRLPSVGVSVWRRRDVLLFVWPEGGEGVRLLAGAGDLEAPRYELAALGPALLGHPWKTVLLRSGGAAPEKPWWNRWVMPLGVTIVAAWLVWLLRRILSEA